MAKLIELRDVYKIYSEGLESEVRALDGVSLTIEKGEFVAIVGQSGSGKSTMMNVLGCLDVPTYGEYLLEGTDVSELSDMQLSRIRNKEIGFIFQQYNLIQSLSVQENVELPLVYQGIGIDDRHELAVHALERVGLVDRRRNKPTQMSGGQQQRVAIARALVTGPAIICMDEPLPNLDAKLRVQLRNELKKMQKDFGITTIYVTHDQEEALTLSDRIAVFNSGVIEQVGTPNEVYNHSATEFVCNFIGDINRLGEGIVNELINMGAPVDPAKHNYIRLERIHVNAQPREGEIALDGTVESLEYYGLYIKYYITVCGQTIKVIEKNDGVNIYDAGQKVKAVFNPRDIMAYEPAAEAEVK
mgnify:CR=1 FL=1